MYVKIENKAIVDTITHWHNERNDKLIELGQDPISIDDYMEIILGSLISDQLNK